MGLSQLAGPVLLLTLPALHTSPDVGMGNHSERVGVHVGTVPSCGSGTASYVVWSYNPWPVPRGGLVLMRPGCRVGSPKVARCFLCELAHYSCA